MSAYEELHQRYATGEVPWDDELPPPELRATLETLPPGRALDLGCGYGRAAIYMARQRWQVEAIDFIDLALEEAARRAEEAGVAAQIQFHLSPITILSYLSGAFDLALDVGCMHNLDEAALRDYRDEVARLLRPGGLYLLFAHIEAAHIRAEPVEYDTDGRPRGLSEPLLYDLFAADFHLERVEHGETTMPDRAPWPSAWFWFRRRG